MKSKLDKLQKILQSTKLEYDAVALADALWLSQYMDGSSKIVETKMDIEKKEPTTPNPMKKPPLSTEEDDTYRELEPTAQKITIQIESEDEVPVHVSTKKTKSQGLSVGIKEEQERFNQGTLYNALRHFRQKRLSHSTLSLDIEKTVDFMADTKLFIPLYRPQYKNRFKLIMIIDSSDTMELWREESGKLLKSIKQFNLFDEVQEFYMDSLTDEPLFFKTKKMRGTGYKNIEQYLTKDTVLMMVSDMSSASWRATLLIEKLFRWQNKSRLFMLQMFPSHLWGRTTLKDAELVRFYSNRKRKFNQNLKSDADDMLVFAYEDYDKRRRLNLPIATMAPNSLEALSKVVVGKASSSVRGAIVFDGSTKQKEQTPRTDMQRVSSFSENSSLMAQELVEYLSVVPLDITVMKMLQRLMLESSTKIHLAEILTSGLLYRDEELYQFYHEDRAKDGVREILQNKLGSLKYIETFQKLSQYVDENIGFSSFFKAILQNSQTTEEGRLNKLDTEFARINIKRLQRLGGEYAKIAERLMIEITVYIPFSKRFMMGSEDGRDNEKPVHEVIINYDFEIAPTPVTVGEFSIFVEETSYVTEAEKDGGAWIWDDKEQKGVEKKDASWKNPYFEQSDDHPVVCVSWNDAEAYIVWLNSKIDETYRLPTEAEWEFACRAGTTTKWHFGDDEKVLKEYAWYDENSDKKNHPVGTKKPNQWGLHDMHGNVWEWCLDDFVDNYNDTPRDGSENSEEKKEYKSLRGGSWNNSDSNTRSSSRSRYIPSNRGDVVGFRLLRTLPFSFEKTP